MNPDAVIGAGALWLAIPLAMLAGLVSFLSPCVLPLVPGYLGFISGAVGASTPMPRSDRRFARPGASGARGPGSATQVGAGPTTRRRLLLGVLLFILGFTVVFVGITALSGTVGVFLVQWSELITRILGVVIIAMGLVFLGFFGFAQREMRMQVSSTAGLVGAPLLGVALGLSWAPCMGPTLTAIVALSFNVGTPARAALLGASYSLGLGIPFLLLALGFGWATRAVGFLRRHIRVVNIIGGAMLIILGILMVAGIWNMIMSSLGAVMGSVILPL
ncbi:cytochrome c biogenesis CcdA family protein [Microbacterium sp. ARD32]|uniref:cytochrome c biogenesis CcdA family protein n=1 Tax=Microbacterium sp. ARD32 TaxID=2962577 RepID=UPI002880EBFE|nr:cytochrome c biogenesis CcdA family protein [Microbacterium sp. ARD32]MDT0156281.1 cytochrome c biogenesis CcdA family protein [Microbacterium sp. ARD32]